MRHTARGRMQQRTKVTDKSKMRAEWRYLGHRAEQNLTNGTGGVKLNRMHMGQETTKIKQELTNTRLC